MQHGTIQIGRRVVLTSISEATALGVRGPVILRCIAPDAEISVGEDSGLSSAVICAAISVTIGKRCLIGADCLILDTDFHNHDAENRRYSSPDWSTISKPGVIEDDVFIGTRSIISKGVPIGRGSIIAAGRVVARDVSQNSVFGGAPAKFLRPINISGPKTEADRDTRTRLNGLINTSCKRVAADRTAPLGNLVHYGKSLSE